MKFSISFLLLIAVALPFASACVGNGNKSQKGKDSSPSDDPSKAQSDAANDPDPLKNKLGLEEGDVDGWDNGVYDDNGGEYVESSDDLECDFEGGCCWTNEQDADDRDWLTSSVQPDIDLFAAAFESTPPADSYLLTRSLDSDTSKTAAFVSCPIKCTDSAVLITFEHYVSNDAIIEVCLRDEGDASSLSDCQAAEKSQQPGPSLFELPKIDSPKQIVIVAKNFGADNGDVAIIDDIVVDFTTCEGGDNSDGSDDGSSEPSGTAEEMDQRLCDEGTTDFSGKNFGGWAKATEVDQPERFGDKPLSEFKIVDDQPAYFGKGGSSVLVLGPRTEDGKEDTGNEYAVCDIRNAKNKKNRESAGLILKDLNIVEDRQLEFDWFDQSFDTVLTVCLDRLDNCQFSSGYKNDFNYLRSWHTAQVHVPRGTKRVIIGGVVDPSKPDEFRNPHSHMGLDNLRWTRPAGGGAASADDPDSNSEDVCDAKRK